MRDKGGKEFDVEDFLERVDVKLIEDVIVSSF